MNAINKSADNYKSKIKFYIRNPQVAHIGVTPEFPRFGHVRFTSYDEMNAWKKELLRSLARRGGCSWKKS